MNKKRIAFIYQFQGTIYAKQLTQPSPDSQYAGQEYYKLKIIQENQPNKVIQVFKEKLANPTIWTTLQQAKRGELPKKTYLFKCRNTRGHYYLVDWEELKEESQ